MASCEDATPEPDAPTPGVLNPGRSTMRSLTVRHAVLLSVVAAIAIAGCTGTGTVAPRPAPVTSAQTNPTTTNAAPPAEKSTDARPSEKPQSPFITNDDTSECSALTASDIKAIA